VFFFFFPFVMKFPGAAESKSTTVDNKIEDMWVSVSTY